jgi:ferredoxin
MRASTIRSTRPAAGCRAGGGAGGGSQAAAASSEARHAEREYQVVFELPDGSNRCLPCGAGEHILDAARRHELELPSSCEQGWDLACAVRVLEGEVDNSDARRYYREDAQAGFALICTAKPLSDLRLQTHQSRAMREHRLGHGLPAPRGRWGVSR